MIEPGTSALGGSAGRAAGVALRVLALVAAAAFGSACDDKDSSKQPSGPASTAPASASTRSVPAPLSSSKPQASTQPGPREAPDAGAPEAGDAGERFVVLAGGDVNLGRRAGQQILRDPDYNPLEKLAPLIDSADLTLVNLESQLSDQNGETQSPRNPLIFTGPPGGARVLKNAGVDVVSVANNHAWDYRRSAFFETLDNLEAAQVGYVGGSKEPLQQYRPLIYRAKGWSVAVFAVTHIWNQGPFEKHPGQHYVAWARYDMLHEALAKAGREHDLVFVSYHGGGEYIDVPMLTTREFVDVTMKAGVDAVFGHHPHVTHGIAWYDERPAFYSLGNLVFTQHQNYPWTGQGFVARMTFSRTKPPKVEACPYRILGHTPTPFEGKAKAPLERAFRRRLKIVSITVGGTTVGEPQEHSCMELTPPLE